MEPRKTLKAWAKEYQEKHGVTLLDPDGFDRKDPKMWERTYTKEEFEQGLLQCTCQWPIPLPFWTMEGKA